MTYAEFFQEFKSKFDGADVSDISEHLAYQFNIEDEEAGGAFYVEVKDGQLIIEPYEFFDRDAMFICAPDVLVKIAEGEMDPVWAFTVQKLRVEANIDNALKLKDIIESKKSSQSVMKKLVSKKKSTGDDTDKKATKKKVTAKKSGK